MTRHTHSAFGGKGDKSPPSAEIQNTSYLGCATGIAHALGDFLGDFERELLHRCG